MKDWKTTKGLYEIHEIGKKINETYPMIATGDEIKNWCKSHNESYGYIEGIGGDRQYECWAVLSTYLE